MAESFKFCKKISKLPFLEKFSDKYNYEVFYSKNFEKSKSLFSQILPFYIHQFLKYNMNKKEISLFYDAFSTLVENTVENVLFQNFKDGLNSILA